MTEPKEELTERKLKILCLHGYNNTKDIMNYQTRYLRTMFDKVLDFHFVEGPHTVMHEDPPKTLVDRGF